MEEWRKHLPVFLRWFRAAMLYPCFLCVWALSMLAMAAFRTETLFILAAAAIWMPFVFFSVARVFAESDEEGNAHLATTQAEGFFARVRAVLVVSVGEVLSGGVELHVVLIGNVLQLKRVTFEYAPITQHNLSIGK